MSPASPLVALTKVGAPMGMDRSLPQFEIPDNTAWMIADAQLTDPGFIRRRGPLTETTSSTRATSRAIGITRSQDLAGVEQMLVFNSKNAGGSEYYGIGNTTITASTWPYSFSTSPYELFCSNDALNGGAFVGTAVSYDNPTNQALGLWRGAGKDDATNLAVSAVAIGNTTITVTSAIASCASGQHVFNNALGTLIGVIKSISGSVITLEFPALAAAATSIDVKAIRGINPRVSKGRITCSTTSAVVNGGLTKFKAQALNTGTWDLFTPNFTYIGTVTSVASDLQLTLTGNAAVSLTNGAYIAIRRDGSYALNQKNVGWLNAQFAGHQFYAQGNLVAFSDLVDPECVDLTQDGDTFGVSADPIRAIVAGLNYLVIITETEAYAIQGAVGTTPDKWFPVRIQDDGTLCGMTALPFQGGCIWAGKRGVWFYDGATPINIVDKLDDDYRLFVSTFNSSTARAYGAICKNHYLLFVEGGKTGVFQRIKGAVVADVTRPTIAVQLDTGAIAMWENVELRGYIQPPDRLARGGCLMPLTTLESAVARVRVVDGEQLFINSGKDPWACEGGPGIGPVLFLETKKYDGGDPQRLKAFRILLLHYWAAGGNILVDIIPGLNGTGTTSLAQYFASTAFQDRRISAPCRSQFVAYRFNESSISGDPNGVNVPADITRITLGPWAIGLKYKRAGRV